MASLLLRRSFASSPPSAMSSLVLSSRSESGKVALLTLNRPKALNALNSELMAELNAQLKLAAEDDTVGCVVLTGAGERAFAAGADIKEMQEKTFSENYSTDFLTSWSHISNFRKPIIGAVHGFCLGGGCELAMMTDIILASPQAVFGQPEINLGIIPGAGGTQRLTRAIGVSRATELLLTGANLKAPEAASLGLISRVVPDAEGQAAGEGVVAEAMRVGEVIAGKGRLSVMAVKEAVKISLEVGLTPGLAYERRLFQALFSTEDQKEGMAAFVEKRKPSFTNK